MNEEEILDLVWRRLKRLYGVKLTKPRIIILKKAKYGTSDKTTRSELILAYCPSAFEKELKKLKASQKDYEKFMIYAFAESLSMGFQKMMFPRCTHNSCRASSSARKYKLVNYVTTYFAADQVVGEKNFGSAHILSKLKNRNAAAVAAALEKVYKNRSEKLILAASRSCTITFDRLCKELKVKLL